MDLLPELGEPGYFDELVWYTPLALEILIIMAVIFFVLRHRQWPMGTKCGAILSFSLAGTLIVFMGYMLVLVVGLSICC